MQSTIRAGLCNHPYAVPVQERRPVRHTAVILNVALDAQVKVKRRGDDQKFLAEVLAVGTECDIALLTVADPAFWEGVTPLVFGALPRLQDGVAVVGYPCAAPSMSTLSVQCMKHLVHCALLQAQSGAATFGHT